jgi:ribosomal protein S6--L-glutamate ligase
MKSSDAKNIGWEEWVALPDLGIHAIKAKVDTGAKTSALHAFMVERCDENGIEKIRFGIHPIPGNPEIEVFCTAPFVEEREVKSSNQQSELRYVINTIVALGNESWPIEISLTNRQDLSHRMLLGRGAIEGRFRIAPEGSCLIGKLSSDIYKQKPAEESRPLKICILSQEPKVYSTSRLVSSAQGKGHEVDVLSTTKLYVNVSEKKQAIHYKGHILDRYDAVIPRIGASITSYGLAMLRQFESLGTYCLNSSNAIAHSRDKLYAHQLLTRGNIGMPVTAFGRSSGDTDDMIQIVGGAPLVIKLLQGSQGESVVLAETNKAAQAVIQAFRGLGADFIVQEYVKESAGRDIRCLVLGTKVIAAMERRAQPGEFRSNIHQGGQGHLIKITSEERKLAVRAAKILGLRFSGVDMLRTDNGPQILEVNSSPGLEGIEGLTKKDIASKVIEFISENARPSLAKRIMG